MKTTCELWKKIIYPRPVHLLLAFCLAVVLLTLSFTVWQDSRWLCFAVYLFAVYVLVAVVLYIPTIWRGTERLLRRNRYASQYFDDPFLRAEVSLYFGLAVNAAYSVFKLVSGIYYRSLWFDAEAVYYIMLSIIRMTLVRRNRICNENIQKEWQSYRLCGWLLFLLNFTMTVIVFLIVVKNQSFEYAGWVIYASAGYTFYRLTIAILQVMRFRSAGKPILSASKALNLSASLMSVFALQTAILTRFGEGASRWEQVLNAVSGSAVCIAVLFIALSMILRVRKNTVED